MRTLARLTSIAALAGIHRLALAHEGHGLEAASHWHATDTAGWIAVAAAIALGVWLSRK